MTASHRPAPHPSAALGAGVAVVGASIVWIAGLGLRATLSLSRSYPVVATGLFACIAGIALSGAGRHHPFRRFGPANFITGLRSGIVALVGAATLEAPSVELAWAVVWLAGVAATLDVVDGWLARRSRMASAFGARFDMEVDALLILVLALLVWRFDKAGVWVVASGLLRYAFVGGAWLLPWLAQALPFSRRRQVICVVQIVSLIVALAPAVASPPSAVLVASSLTALVWSFWVDVAWLARAKTTGR